MPVVAATWGIEATDPRNGASKAKTPPSSATSQYPPVDESAAMSITGALRVLPPIEPWKAASPKADTPPSAATSQYPPPSLVDVMATTGALSGWPPMDPKYPALPKAKAPPSPATSQ